MRRPELVLFDLDGTLLDGSGLPGAMRATCAVLAPRLPGASVDDLVAANTAAWQRLWPEVEDAWMHGDRTGDDIGEEAWRETLLAGGSDDPALLRLALTTWDAEQRRAFRLFDDVLPVLDRLDGDGVRVGLVTNGAASVQRLKLEAVEAAHRFEPLLISGDVGIRKPDPGIFAAALHDAGVAAAAAWYVGDNLWHDVAPAHEAGLVTAWIDRRGVEVQESWPRPDLVLRSLAGLPDLWAGQDPR